MSARTIHPFPARMAPEIALGAIPLRQDARLTVLDPMCGSGTVLSVASSRGHDAIGIDIDPLAVMMSTLAVTAVDTTELVDIARNVTQSAKAGDGGSAPWGDDEETERFVQYWFGERQRRELTRLTGAIESLGNGDIQLVLRLAISRIIVTKSSQASLAQDTSHSRPHRVRTESDYDVYAGFERSVVQLARMLKMRELRGSGKVMLGDARKIDKVAENSVDIALTSPPYLNALDYLRGHKLALVWFGHTIPEIRARRSISIGAERGIGGDASEVVSGIVDLVESDAVDAGLLKRPMVERFAQDCVGFAEQLAAKVKDGGTAVLVVGNSTLRGNYIRNDLIARRAMEHAGFRHVADMSRPIPPSNRYMAIDPRDSESSLAKRMRSEVVLTMVR